MAGYCPFRSLVVSVFLYVDGKIDMRYSAVSERGSAGEVGDLLDVGGSHDTGVVHRDVHEDSIEIDVLLSMRIDEIVEMMSRDRKHRLPVELGIVETVEQVQATGARGREAH